MSELQTVATDLTGSESSFFLSEETAETINSLGLMSLLEDFARDGYAVLTDAAAPEVTDRIREAILSRATSRGSSSFAASASLLLGTDEIFEEAVLNPKVMALVEAVCGKGALLSQLLGSVRQPGPGKIPLHADQSWMPDPFPVQTQLMTFCWVCDDYTQAGGATKVVPQSHKLRRFPTAEEIEEEAGAIPIVCPKGSIAVWLGETWHGNYPREADGERVVLHMTYSRITMRPVENYDHLDDAWLSSRPAAMRQLLGRDDFLDKKNLDRSGSEYLTQLKNTQTWGRTNTFHYLEE